MISTAGMIGWPGKWPWKNGSLMVTFLMPSIALPSSMRGDAVHQQERVAVRHDVHDRRDVPLVGRAARRAARAAAASRLSCVHERDVALVARAQRA